MPNFWNRNYPYTRTLEKNGKKLPMDNPKNQGTKHQLFTDGSPLEHEKEKTIYPSALYRFNIENMLKAPKSNKTTRQTVQSSWPVQQPSIQKNNTWKVFKSSSEPTMMNNKDFATFWERKGRSFSTTCSKNVFWVVMADHSNSKNAFRAICGWNPSPFFLRT